MRLHHQKRALALAAFTTLAAYSIAKADTSISNFTPGDLVVLRGGDASNPTTGSTVTVGAYLDEYSPAGVYQGTIGVPQVASGSNNPLTLTNGVGSHEGILTLSANGNWLTFGGYDTPPPPVPAALVSQLTPLVKSLKVLRPSTRQPPPPRRLFVPPRQLMAASFTSLTPLASGMSPERVQLRPQQN